MFEVTGSEYVSEHERLRRNLEEDIDNFLAEGNEIEEVDFGHSHFSDMCGKELSNELARIKWADGTIIDM